MATPMLAETGEPLRVIEVTPAELPIPAPQVPEVQPEPIEEPVEVPRMTAPLTVTAEEVQTEPIVG